VGREPELAAVSKLLNRGGAAVVRGAAGMGRTRFLRELSDRVRSLGLRVAVATAHESEQDVPRGVARQLFGPVRSAAEFFEAATASEPVLIAVDDVHWSDPESVQWLGYLLRRISQRRIWLVVTTGPWQHLAELGRHMHSEILLEPLDLAGVAEVVERELGAPSDPAFTAACHEVTGGHPILVSALLRHLRADRAIPTGRTACLLAEVAPPEIATWVRAELGDIVTVLALLNEHATDTDLVAEVADQPTTATEDCLRRVARSGIPIGAGIVRQAILKEVPAVERERLHLRVAIALAERGAPCSHLAEHLAHTAFHDVACSADATARLAKALTVVGRWTEAITLLTNRAESIRANDPAAAEGLRAEALYYRLVGLPAPSRALVEAVFAARKPPHGLSVPVALAEAEADARGRLDDLALSGARLDHPHALLAVGCLLDVLVHQGKWPAAEALADDVGELPALWSAAGVLLGRGRLRMAVGQAEDGLADFVECGRLMRDCGPVGSVLYPWRSDAALACAALGDRAQACELAERHLALARRWGRPGVLGTALRTVGTIRGGKDGVSLLREAVSLLRDTPLELARTHADLGVVLRRTNQLAPAREALRTAATLAVRCGAHPLAEFVVAELRAVGARPRSSAFVGVEALTPSELRTAALAADGLTNREIAQRMSVVRRTVEIHLSSAYRKLCIPGRAQLAQQLKAAW
jgi:DNA-binding CsgD family transcriptional regulator